LKGSTHGEAEGGLPTQLRKGLRKGIDQKTQGSEPEGGATEVSRTKGRQTRRAETP
jgi:hypothetical protein